MGKWEMVQWGQVLQIKNGKNQKAVESSSGAYPIYGSGGIMGCASDYICPEKTTIIGRKGSINSPIYVEQKFWNVDTAFGLVANANLDSRFLYYFCVQYNFERHNRAVTIPSLTKSDLLQISMPLPPLDEQKRIAKNLDLASEIVKGYKEQLAELDKLVQSVFYEMFGDPVTNEKGWEVKLLSNICDGIGDGLHGTPTYDENGKYPFINGNNLVDGCIVTTDATKYIGENEYQRLYIDITENAVLISINGTLGKLAFYNGEKISISKSACYCNLKPEINRLFIYWIMKSRGFANFLESSSTKSTIKNVGLKAMREFKTILPSPTLQTRFASIVTEIESQKAQVQKALTEAENLFNSLMQEYFE